MRSYKVGEKTASGHLVKQILGQGPDGAVYTTSNNEIRWSYWANDGRLPDALGSVIARFDTLLVEIRGVEDKGEKRTLYELAGKALYLAFHSGATVDPLLVFAEVESRIIKIRKQSKHTSPESKAADVVIVCALHDPELQSMLSVGPVSSDFHLDRDPQTYHETQWNTVDGKTLRVIIAAPNQMGLTAAGVLTAKMVLQFRPKVVAMGGIAAGTKYGAQGFGDIVAPEHTFDYGASKSIDVGKGQEILNSPQPLSIQARLLGRLKEWQRTRTGLDEIARGWQATRPSTALQIHTGPIFSAPTVQQTNKNIERLLSQWRKLSAVEMEAYAVHRACNDTIEPPPMFFCAKSVCDFASGKSDDWQRYAAYTSAGFIHSFLTREWSKLVWDIHR